MFGICDGHGSAGKNSSSYSANQISIAVEADECLLSAPKLALFQAFMKANSDLLRAPFDVGFSGTTASVVLITPNKIYCANAGDSRAILGRVINGK